MVMGKTKYELECSTSLTNLKYFIEMKICFLKKNVKYKKKEKEANYSD